MDKVEGSVGPRWRHPLAVPVAALAALVATASVAVAAPDSVGDIVPAYAANEGSGLRGAKKEALVPANPANVRRTVQKLSPKSSGSGERISPNSRVGLIAAYIDAVEASARADTRIAAIDQQVLGLGKTAPDDPKLKALQAERANLAAARDTLRRAQRDALDATASKPMSEELLAAINAILGIESSTALTGDGDRDPASGDPQAEPGPAAKSAPVEPSR